jgi:hypothetical protein
VTKSKLLFTAAFSISMASCTFLPVNVEGGIDAKSSTTNVKATSTTVDKSQNLQVNDNSNKTQTIDQSQKVNQSNTNQMSIGGSNSSGTEQKVAPVNKPSFKTKTPPNQPAAAPTNKPAAAPAAFQPSGSGNKPAPCIDKKTKQPVKGVNANDKKCADINK